MSDMNEQLKLQAIEQSTRELEMSLGELIGVANGLEGVAEGHVFATRLHAICEQMRQALDNVQYVTAQGHVPQSEETLLLGERVQESLNVSILV